MHVRLRKSPILGVGAYQVPYYAWYSRSSLLVPGTGIRGSYAGIGAPIDILLASFYGTVRIGAIGILYYERYRQYRIPR